MIYVHLQYVQLSIPVFPPLQNPLPQPVSLDGRALKAPKPVPTVLASRTAYSGVFGTPEGRALATTANRLHLAESRESQSPKQERSKIWKKYRRILKVPQKKGKGFGIKKSLVKRGGGRGLARHARSRM